MERFLITGGAGFIGSNLAGFLTDKGCKVVVFDDFSTGCKENLFGVGGRIEVIEGDVRDKDLLMHVCREIDYVLHQAAWRAVGRGIDDPVRANEVNLTGSLNVLEASRRSGVKRVVLASSSAVYGKREGMMSEKDNLAPISPYAVAKVAAEMYGQVYQRLYGLEVVSLRYFNVYGRNIKAEQAYALVLPALVDAVLNKRAPEIHGTGSQRRDLIHVEDVARAVWAAAFHKKAAGKIYNVGSGQAVSVLELYKEVCRACEIRVGWVNGPRREGDVELTLADNKLMRKELGVLPEKKLRDGVAEYCQWYKEKMVISRAFEAA